MTADARDLGRELSEAQAQLRSVLDNVPAMIAYWDTDLLNRMGNQAYVDWFGITPEQMRGRHIREVIGEDLFALNEPYMRRALAGEAQTFDRTIVDAHGVTRHTQASYLPDVVEGEVRGFFVLVTDVTARKLAEVALADETERVRTTLDAVGDAVLSLDLELRVTDLNLAAVVLTGCARGDGIGVPVQQLVQLLRNGPGDVHAEVDVLAACRESLAGGYSRRGSGDDELVGRHGRVTPVDWLVTPLRGASGDLRGLVLTFRDVRATRALLAETEQRATHDALTGLKNRRHLERLRQRRHADAALPTAVLFLDLDGFKPVNDTAGHAAGDAVLCEVADVLRQAVRASDELVRLGGDEFGVLLTDCDLAGALRVAEEVVERIGRHRFCWHGKEFRLGVSVGLALAGTGERAPVEALLAEADAACYAAKRAGGSRVVVTGLPVPGPR